MEINAGSYVYSTSRLNCNSWRIWFRTAISLKFDSFRCRNELFHHRGHGGHRGYNYL